MPNFVSDADAKMMLGSSVVLHLGRLVLCTNVRNQMAYCTDIETGEPYCVPADLDHFKAPITGYLGYINVPDGSVFVQRMAARVVKMGFHNDNLRPKVCHSRQGWSLFRGGLDRLRLTYENQFPSFAECVDRAKIGLTTAYDRSWAIRKGEVLYQGVKVGVPRSDKEEDIDFNIRGKKLLLVRNRPKLNWG